jgi:preprotein translocase subunit SecA
MFGGLAKSLFGSSNDRYVRSLNPILAKIEGFEPTLKAMSTTSWRRRPSSSANGSNGEKLDAILPEAFATVREAASACSACAISTCR